MNHRKELVLITLLLLLAAVLRISDLTRLPPGFSDDELASIRMTETARQGRIAVYYQVGDDVSRAGAYTITNMLVTALVGDGLLGYRLLSVWGGLVSVALLYRLTRRLFSVPVALVAAGVLIVNIRAVLLARTVTAEALVPMYVMTVLLLTARAFHLRREVRYLAPDTLEFAFLAVLLGAPGYLHYTLLLLGPLVAVFFGHLVLTRQPISRRTWNAFFFLLVLATVTAVPYLISTVRDSTSSELYRVWELRPRSATDVVDGVLSAVGGIVWRGDADPTRNVPEAALVGPILGLLLVVGVITALRRWRQPRYALVLLPFLAGLATDAWMSPQPNFAANLVALPSTAMLIGVGTIAVWRWLRSTGRVQAWQPAALVLALLLAVNVLVLRERVFNDWPQTPEVKAAYQSNIGYLAAYFDRKADGPPVVMCSVPLRDPNRVGMTERQVLGVMMHREMSGMRFTDCRGALVFVNGGEPMRFAFADADYRALMPDALRSWLDDAAPILVEGVPDGTVLWVDVVQRLSDAGGMWNLYSPTQFDPETNGSGAMAELPVTLEQNLTFAGYDPAPLQQSYVAGGDRPIVLVTYWRVDGPLPPDLGIFAHVVGLPDENGGSGQVPLREPWAEANALDVTVSRLENRDVFAQVSYIWLGDSLRTDRYAVMVGAYQGSVYNHLRVLDRESGVPRGDRLLLGTVEITAAPEASSPSAE